MGVVKGEEENHDPLKPRPGQAGVGTGIPPNPSVVLPSNIRDPGKVEGIRDMYHKLMGQLLESPATGEIPEDDFTSWNAWRKRQARMEGTDQTPRHIENYWQQTRSKMAFNRPPYVYKESTIGWPMGDFFTLLCGESEENIPPDRRDYWPRCKLNIPHTLVYGRSENPLWMYTAPDGTVRRTEKWGPKSMLKKLRPHATDDDIVGIKKLFPDRKDPMGNDNLVLTKADFLQACPGTNTDKLIIQDFVNHRGPYPFFVRAWWRVGKPLHTWLIANRFTKDDIVAEPSMNKRVCTTHFVEKSECFTMANPVACAELKQFCENIVQHVELTKGVRFTEIAVDFMKDEKEKWIALQVKSFQLHKQFERSPDDDWNKKPSLGLMSPLEMGKQLPPTMPQKKTTITLPRKSVRDVSPPPMEMEIDGVPLWKLAGKDLSPRDPDRARAEAFRARSVTPGFSRSPSPFKQSHTRARAYTPTPRAKPKIVAKLKQNPADWEQRIYDQQLAKVSFLSDDYWYTDTPIKPCASFYRFLHYSDSNKLKMWIPDTIVFGDKDEPFWIYNDKEGNVCYEGADRIKQGRVLRLFEKKKLRGSFGDDCFAVVKVPDYRHASGQVPRGHMAGATSKEDISKMMISQPADLTIVQNFVKPDGLKAHIVRAVWNKFRPATYWSIYNRHGFDDKKIPDLTKRVLTWSGAFGSNEIFKTSYKASRELDEYHQGLVKFLKNSIKPRVDLEELVADYTKAEDGKWYLLQVKAFRLCPKLGEKKEQKEEEEKKSEEKEEEKKDDAKKAGGTTPRGKGTPEPPKDEAPKQKTPRVRIITPQRSRSVLDSPRHEVRPMSTTPKPPPTRPASTPPVRSIQRSTTPRGSGKALAKTKENPIMRAKREAEERRKIASAAQAMERSSSPRKKAGAKKEKEESPEKKEDFDPFAEFEEYVPKVWEERTYWQEINKATYCDEKEFSYKDLPIEPLIKAFKNLAPVGRKSGLPRLKLKIPTTLIYHDGELAPTMYWTGEDGYIYRKENFKPSEALRLIGNKAQPSKVCAVMKVIDYKKNQLANKCSVMNTEDLSTLVNSPPNDLTLVQQFIMPAGTRACMQRCVWRDDKPTIGWRLANNRAEYKDKEADDKRLLVRTDVWNDATVYEVRGLANKEHAEYSMRIRDFLEEKTKKTFQLLVTDYVKDVNGEVWFLQIKAFQFLDRHERFAAFEIPHVPKKDPIPPVPLDKIKQLWDKPKPPPSLTMPRLTKSLRDDDVEAFRPMTPHELGRSTTIRSPSPRWKPHTARERKKPDPETSLTLTGKPKEALETPEVLKLSFKEEEQEDWANRIHMQLLERVNFTGPDYKYADDPGLNPLASMWKFMTRNPDELARATYQMEVLTLDVPDTLVLNDGDNPLNITTQPNGKLKRSHNFEPKSLHRKWTKGVKDPKQIVAVVKSPDFRNPGRSIIQCLTSEELLNAFLSPPKDKVVYQRFLSCKGRKASINRVTWRLGRPPTGWVVTNKLYVDDDREKVPVPKLCTCTSDLGNTEIFQVKGPAARSLADVNYRVLKYIERSMKGAPVTFREFTADYLKGKDDKWYLLQVKSFLLAEKRYDLQTAAWER